MQTLTMPIRRFYMDRSGVNPNQAAGVFPTTNSPTTYPAPAPLGRYAMMGESNGGFQSADLLLSDVVSFDVRVLLKGTLDFVDLFDPSVQAFSNNNPAFVGNGPRVFDTWSNADGPAQRRQLRQLGDAATRPLASHPVYTGGQRQSD